MSEINFKKCPYCQSEKIGSVGEDPDWIIGEKGRPSYFNDEMKCNDCEGNWAISYKPSKIHTNEY